MNRTTGSETNIHSTRKQHKAVALVSSIGAKSRVMLAVESEAVSIAAAKQENCEE